MITQKSNNNKKKKNTFSQMKSSGRFGVSEREMIKVVTDVLRMQQSTKNVSLESQLESDGMVTYVKVTWCDTGH